MGKETQNAHDKLTSGLFRIAWARLFWFALVPRCRRSSDTRMFILRCGSLFVFTPVLLPVMPCRKITTTLGSYLHNLFFFFYLCLWRHLFFSSALQPCKHGASIAWLCSALLVIALGFQCQHRVYGSSAKLTDNKVFTGLVLAVFTLSTNEI